MSENMAANIISNTFTIDADQYINSSLRFIMQRQLKSNWCWAATSTSVSYYYNSNSPWTQCRVACTILHRNDCCNDGDPNLCNVVGKLNEALTVTGNYVTLVFGVLSAAKIQAQINAGAVIGARIEWADATGHFVAIYGINQINGQYYLNIADPIYGNSILPIDEFANRYQGRGQWNVSYITKSVQTF